MAKKSKVERILMEHNKNLLELNRSFISAIGRPRPATENIAKNVTVKKKRLSKAQREALARGRKILASKRGK